MLVAAPAFGGYSLGAISEKQKDEIQFLCALNAYRAQFQEVLRIKEGITKPVIFKPKAPGLGVFGNKTDNVAKAFYTAANEFESSLAEAGVQVKLQVFQARGEAMEMANRLKLTTP